MESHPERNRISMTKTELADFARTVAQEVLVGLDAAQRLEADEQLIVTGALVINLPSYEASVAGVRVKLKPREFAMLAALARNLGRVLTREQLLGLAWPEPEGVDDARTVDVHVRRVRMALGAAAGLVETVVGVGYKLSKAPVPAGTPA